MDGFSTLAAAIGLLETTRKVIVIVKNIRHARDQAEVLCTELQRLDSNLQAVRSLATSKHSHKFSQTSVLTTGARSCNGKLKALLRDLEKVQDSKVERLKWAFKKEHYRELLQEMRAFSHILHFAVSLDSIKLLAQSAEDAMKALQLQSQNLGVLMTLDDTAKRIESKVDENFAEWKTSEALRRRDKVTSSIDDYLRSLGDKNQERRHNKIRQARCEHTGSWFFNDSTFKRWLNSSDSSNVDRYAIDGLGGLEPRSSINNSPLGETHTTLPACERVFLCQGSPGSGKSTLASLVIDVLRDLSEISKDGTDCTLYYYFDYNDEQSHVELHLILYFLRQMVQTTDTTQNEIPQIVARLENAFSISSEPKPEHVRSVLYDMLHAHNFSNIVLDALDELHIPSRRAVYPFLSSLASMSNVKIFVTSRYTSDLEHVFPHSIPYDFRAPNADIRQYLRDEIAKETRFDANAIDDEMQRDIVARILDIASGMFLLAKLLLQSVLDGVTPGDRRDALRTMPEDLPSFFEKTLERIWKQPPQMKTIAENTLLWILEAKIPLGADQVQEALSIDLKGRSLSSEYRPHLNTILKCCQGFVRLGVYDRLIFIHKAVYDYLKEHMATELKSRIAQLTMTYIKDLAFCQGPVKDPESYEGKYPFLAYLSRYWMIHLKEGLKYDFSCWKDLFEQYRPHISFMYQYNRWNQGYNKNYFAIDEAWSLTHLLVACQVC